jgi:hypothetical protein
VWHLQGELRMKNNATLAIPLVLAMLLSACGGGGGGQSASSTAGGGGGNTPEPPSVSTPLPAPDPAAQPDPAPPPTNLLQAGAFAPFGPTIIASNVGKSFDKGLTSAARLTGGGSVVAWAAGTTLFVQRLDADGHAVGAAQTVGAVFLGDFAVPRTFDVSTRLSVVATADGGWLVAWISTDRSVLFRRYDAAGAPAAAPAPVDATVFTQVLGIQARALADGGFVVAWVAGTGTDPTRAYLRRFNAAGAAVTNRLGVSNSAGAQSAVQVTPMPDGHFLAAWVQGNSDGTETLLARRLDAALNGAGPEQVLQPAGPQVDAYVHRYSLLGAAARSDAAALFAWAYYDGGSTLQVRWQRLDALGTPTIPAGSPAAVSIRLDRFIDSVEVIPAAPGFRIVAESNFANYRLNEGYTTIIDIGAAGELLGSNETSRTLSSINAGAGNGCGGPRNPGVAASGGEDGHYLLAYATCAPFDPYPATWPPANLEVVGR